MKKNTPIIFVSGLPRSGSTLLMNLLGQCPAHHVTPTNDLLDLIVQMRDSWTDMISFKAQGLDNIKPRVLDAMEGVIQGFFSKELEEGKIIFDKSRGWIAYIELLEEILQRPVKIIVTVRDVRSIVSSFEKLNRKSMMTKPNPKTDAFYDMQTIDGRARQLLHIKSVVGLSIARLRDALNRGVADRLIMVPYFNLTSDTVNTMNNLHDALGLERYDYSPEFVKQVTQEDDSVHGMKLHEIRNEVKFQEPDWDKILTPHVCEWIANEYKDINNIARGR